MPEIRIEGKFYALQTSEWIEISRKLTHSELMVFYYLRTIDPFGNKFREIETLSIAKIFNISRRAVQRAISKLANLELIDLQVSCFKFRIKSKPPEREEDLPLATPKSTTSPQTATEQNFQNPETLKPETLKTEQQEESDNEETVNPQPSDCQENLQSATAMSPSDRNVATTTAVSPERQECRQSDRNVATTTAVSPPSPKTLTKQGLQKPKTIKTYSDFKDSLSERERESFLEFGKKRANQLPYPPQLPLRWIEKNWEEIAKGWRKSRGEKFIPSSRWETDPRTAEWLAICEKTKNALEFASGDKEKIDFVKWANINRKFSWLGWLEKR